MKRNLQTQIVSVPLFLLIGALIVASLWQSSTAVFAADSAAEVRTSLSQTQTTSTTVSAVGKIELVRTRPVVLQSSAMVEQVAVAVGDQVSAGSLLVMLDTLDLEIAVRAAEIGLEQARINLRAVSETIDASVFAVAEANLLAAQENLATVQAGPSKEEIEAAKSSAAAAWSAYSALKEGALPAQIQQASVALKLAEIDLKIARRAYEQVSWMPDVGMTGEAAALERATLNFDSANAGYTLATQPATPAQLQSAISGAQSAQHALNELQKRPTPADLANAKAGVASAEATLVKLKKGSKADEIRNAELGVEQAKMGFDAARRALANARLTAPIAGTVLAVDVIVGQMGGAGSTVVTLADVDALQLTVNVEQRDLPRVTVGQKVEVSVYGFGTKIFAGEVERIAPLSQSTSGPVSFPVTIKLTDDSLDGLRSGMAATATFLEK